MWVLTIFLNHPHWVDDSHRRPSYNALPFLFIILFYLLGN